MYYSLNRLRAECKAIEQLIWHANDNGDIARLQALHDTLETRIEEIQAHALAKVGILVMEAGERL